MTVLRVYGAGLIVQGQYLLIDFGPGHNQVARGDSLPGPNPIDTTGASTGQVLSFNGTAFVPTTFAAFSTSTAWTFTALETFNAGIQAQHYVSTTGFVFGLGSSVPGTLHTTLDANGALCVGVYPDPSVPTLSGQVNASKGYTINDPNPASTHPYVPLGTWNSNTEFVWGVSGAGTGAGAYTLRVVGGAGLTFDSPSYTFKVGGAVRLGTQVTTATYSTDASHAVLELNVQCDVTLTDAASVDGQEIDVYDLTGNAGVAPHRLLPNNSKLIDGYPWVQFKGRHTKVRKDTTGNWRTTNGRRTWPPQHEGTRDRWDPDLNFVGSTWAGAVRGTPLTGTNIPSLSTGIAGFNGHTAATFVPASSTSMNSPTGYLSFAMSQAMTIFLCGKFRPGASNAFILDSGGPDIFMNNVAGQGMGVYAGMLSYSAVIPSGNFEIWCIIIDSTTTTFIKDGTFITTVSCGLQTGAELFVGSSTALASFADMDLGVFEVNSGKYSQNDVIEATRDFGLYYNHPVA